MKYLLILLNFVASCPTAHGWIDAGRGAVCGTSSQDEFMKQLESRQDSLLNRLGLTPDQKQKIQKLHHDHSEILFTQVQKVRLAHTEAVQALEKNAPDEVVKERMLNLVHERESLVSSMLDLHLAIRAVLTPEQRQRAVAQIKDKTKALCE